MSISPQCVGTNHRRASHDQLPPSKKPLSLKIEWLRSRGLDVRFASGLLYICVQQPRGCHRPWRVMILHGNPTYRALNTWLSKQRKFIQNRHLFL